MIAVCKWHFKRISLNENYRIVIQIALKFVLRSPIDYNVARNRRQDIFWSIVMIFIAFSYNLNVTMSQKLNTVWWNSEMFTEFSTILRVF